MLKRINKIGKKEYIEYFDSVAEVVPKWRKKNYYFHSQMEKYIKFIVPQGSSVLQIGCETGELLNSLRPRRGLGIDLSPRMIDMAAKNFTHLEFKIGDIETLDTREKFDYVVLGTITGYVDDIQVAFEHLKNVCRPDTRVVVVYYNYFWEGLLKLLGMLGLRLKRPIQHWFTANDIQNFLYLTDFEVIKKEYCCLLPVHIPLISSLANRLLANISFFRDFSLLQILVARLPLRRKPFSDISCSVIVPCRNEKGNIEQVVTRIPNMGKSTEIIFVEGNSQDGTFEECLRIKNKYPQRDIKVFRQSGKGKGDAVRAGFSHAGEDILFILDADLTVPPEELPKFFDAAASGKGELVSGSRLVYSMEKEAMRFLNVLGNKFFSNMFTFLLEQYIKDTLCGTKVLWREDYERIAKNRAYFGDFDPFGDFDLLFGAAKLNLRIIEIPVHYRERTYGSTQIRRFRHGWLLLQMTFIAMKKIKFI